MKMVISEKALEKEGLKLGEALILILVKLGTDIPQLVESMKEKEMIADNSSDLFQSLYIPQRWDECLQHALLNDDDDVPNEKTLLDIANRVRECFPKGNKPNTNSVWRGNKREIMLKLKWFFKLYGNYTADQIVDAAKRYVASFNGNYEYMRVCKYFIFKNDKTQGEVSELATFLENEDAAPTDNQWDVELR